ncbi:MAG: hypothetical protein IPG59_20590 [Candidatus Melainabacteria bacterium]|nr:MAG: hypothetical protein IPG59_20590 [Candidatus Melainabacteria bacterium]
MLFAKNFNTAILFSILTGAALLSTASLPSLAQSSSSSSSSSSSEVTRGVGFRQTNKFEFKYKERIKTYEDQIQMGLKRGWLSSADAEIFSSRLLKLKEMEASVSANGYPKAELDTLEQEITKFNKEFSDAGQKTKTVTAPSVAPTAAPQATPAVSPGTAPSKSNAAATKTATKTKSQQKKTTKTKAK